MLTSGKCCKNYHCFLQIYGHQNSIFFGILILLRVTMDDETTSELDLTFTTLMGDKVEPRREFIVENAKYVKNLDV